MADPNLGNRLTIVKLDRLFQNHLQEAFGEKQREFSPMLRERLRVFWQLALGTGLDENEAETVKAALAQDGVYRKGACPSCGGSGMGDYPWECNHCGGSGQCLVLEPH